MALLTITELREHVTSELGDDALSRVLDACQAELDRWAGPLPEAADGALEEVTETVRGRRRTLLPLSRVPASVTTVTDVSGTTETDLLIDDDWRIRDAYLERAGGAFWGDRTVVTYVPADDRALRRRALVKLVQLDLNHNPGAGSVRIGDWSRSTPAGGTYEDERAAILATIREPEPFA